MNATHTHHVVVGSGATGRATALLLAEEGHRVRIVSRSGTGPVHPHIERVTADASIPAELTAITSGAVAIYNCANPQYHQWTTDWPPLAHSLLTAAEASGAVLATLSNLYGYALPTRPMLATDALDTTTVKGRIRADMWADAKAAHDQSRIRAVEVRASDFIGPGLGQTSHMGDRVVPRVLAGKPVSLLGRVDVVHSWTAVDDVARALVTAAASEQAWGRAWHVPSAPPMTQTAMVEEIARIAGVPPVKVKTVPRLALSLLGVAVPAMRELKEVLYQFEAPFVMDSSETTEVLGLTHTPIEETLRKTVDSYQPQAHAVHG